MSENKNQNNNGNKTNTKTDEGGTKLDFSRRPPHKPQPPKKDKK